MKTICSLKISVAVTVLACWLPIAGRAGDYLGAAAVLQQLTGNPAPSKNTPAQDAAAVQRLRFDSFVKGMDKQDAKELVAQWLEFFDAAAKPTRQRYSLSQVSTNAVTVADLMAHLPPPAAWAEFSAAVAGRKAPADNRANPESGLKLLAAALTGDTNSWQKELDAVQKRVDRARDDNQSMSAEQALRRFSEEAMQRSEDPELTLKYLERQLEEAASGDEQQIAIPNLMARVGQDKTEAFLRKALVAPNVRLEFYNAGKTADLARKLAVRLVSQMKTPQWGLVNSLDSVDLYEALNKKFPEPAKSKSKDLDALPGLGSADMEDSSGRNEARVYYMLGLIAKGRMPDALAAAKKISSRNGGYVLYQAFDEMDRAGLGGALADFLHELIAGDLDSPFWSEYVEVAAKTGHSEEMLALVEKAAARPGLSDAKKGRFLSISMSALLAADKVDEGVAKLRELAKAGGTADAGADPMDEETGYTRGRLGVILANIGSLVQKPELVDEGVTMAKEWVAGQKTDEESSYEADSVVRAIAHVLVKANRGPEAEALLAQQLTREVPHSSGGKVTGISIQSGRDDTRATQTLGELVTIYFNAGRYDDVLTLVNDCPYWGIKDLAGAFRYNEDIEELGGLRSLHNRGSTNSLASMVAIALLNKGDKEAAAKIDDELLNRVPGLDRGYELLIKLDGLDVSAKLDGLYARDQFEERPLIWKGHVLRLLGKPADSEAVLPQAIAIDPSDGEEGKGDRMRVYAELAETLDVEGKKTEADTYREVVKAIRISEDADDFYLAGLVSRAVKMYETGLSHFTDAYCIQSRLAVQMSELGLQKEAEEHYRKAFELMPSSFGRVESHCFGCEGAFAGKRAQDIAEQVFTKIAAAQPDKPQVHYLLGYLHQQEENYAAARTNLLTAVKLDPDYLNAWAKLQECEADGPLSPKEANEVVFNILRLDPLRRHQSPDLSRVTDLKQLWPAVEKANSMQVKIANEIYPFAASRTRINQLEAEAASNPVTRRVGSVSYEEYRRGELSPSGALGQTPLVKLASELMGGGYGMSFD